MSYASLLEDNNEKNLFDSHVKRVNRRLLQWDGGGASTPVVEKRRRRDELEIAMQQLRLLIEKLRVEEARNAGSKGNQNREP